MRNPWELLMQLLVAADVWLFAAAQRMENHHAHLFGKDSHNARSA